jgi:hypothetical protein
MKKIKPPASTKSTQLEAAPIYETRSTQLQVVCSSLIGDDGDFLWA